MSQQFKSTKMGKGETKVMYSHKMMALHHKKFLNKQFRDQPNITAQQGYVLKSIKINFA
jgi:hypothetical protein